MGIRRIEGAEGALRALIGVVLALALSAGPASPELIRTPDGIQPFAFGAGVVDVRADTLRLVVIVRVIEATDSTTIKFSLDMPSELQLVAGERTTVVRDLRGGIYTFLLVPHDRDTFVVRGRLEVQRADRHDIAELECEIDRRDQGSSSQSALTLAESRRAGVRYRYGNEYLVPLDSAEVGVTTSDFEYSGQRAKLIRPVEAVCSGCDEISKPDSVLCVVATTCDGAAREIGVGRSLSTGVRAEGKLRETVKAALKSSRYVPARFHGKPVSDLIHVIVNVRPG